MTQIRISHGNAKDNPPHHRQSHQRDYGNDYPPHTRILHPFSAPVYASSAISAVKYPD
jgi:hypothetical protein